MRQVGILVISDRSSRGERSDKSGPLIQSWAEAANLKVAALEITPDEATFIQEKLRLWADELHLDLILTSGGTGLGPRDVTPEATLAVLERQAQGIPELLRATTGIKTPVAALSRAVAGTRGQALIVNLPGSPKAVEEWLDVLGTLLPHAFSMLDGKTHEQASPHSIHTGGNHD